MSHPQWISREAVARSVLKFNVCLVTDEQELDQFLGKLISKVSRTAGSIIRSSAGKALGGILKGAAKKALPIAGRVGGNFFGGPAGGAIGGELASAVGRIFGLELEGMSGEDQEFEVARRFVRLAASAAQKAAAARSAVAAAARRHAPGLLSPSVGGTLSTAYGGGRARSGSLGSPRTQDHRARRLRPEPLKRKENARHRFNTRRGQNQLVSKRQSRRALSTTSSRSRKWTSKLAARSARSRRQNSLRDCLQSRARKNLINFSGNW